MAADFDEGITSTYKGKQRFNRKGTPLLPPEEVRSTQMHALIRPVCHCNVVLTFSDAV